MILDNASIHHCDEFKELVRAAGGIVRFTPPYCFDCTPLDNGAFGWVKRYVMKKDYLRQASMDRALEAAFKAMPAKKAEEFFRNCGIMG